MFSFIGEVDWLFIDYYRIEWDYQVRVVCQEQQLSFVSTKIYLVASTEGENKLEDVKEAVYGVGEQHNVISLANN